MLRIKLCKCRRASVFALTVLIALMGAMTGFAQVEPGAHAPIAFANLAQVAPDEQHVASVTADDLGMHGATIWVARPDGSERIAVATGDDNFWVTNPIWSPDSRRLAYLKVLDVEYDEFSVFPKFELWAVNADGTENTRLTDAPVLNPALGYGGEAAITWNEQGEIRFEDNTVFPMAQYALTVATGQLQKIGETTGALGETFVGGQPANVPYFSQCDSRWKNNRLGTCSRTICNAGCAMSSVAMLLKYYGANVDPASLNSWLTSHGGYASGCLIYWGRAANYAQGVSYITSTGADWNRLRAELNAGYPVIVNVHNGGHWVVVTHYSGSTYYINDPGYSGRPTLASYGNTFSRMVVYHGPRPSPVPTPTTPTPQITGVAPNPLRPLPVTLRQPFTISGSGFVSGAKLLFKIVDAPTYTYPNRVPTALNATQIVYNISVGLDTHNWTVQVINPDGKASNVYPFRVAPPTAPPTPTPVPNPTRKTLTLVSDPGTYVEETGQGAVATYIGDLWNRSLVDAATGTTWIWSAYQVTANEAHSGSTWRTFRETFSIPAGARNLTGSIQMGFDDFMELYLNGRLIAQDAYYFETYKQYTFTPQVGNNILQVKIKNLGNINSTPTSNPAGVIYRAEIAYDSYYTATINKLGNGAGTVTGSGISCGSDCTENYTPGAQVVLTATPAVEALFTGWQGACSGTGSCTLTMNADQTATAVFTRKPQTITASAAPGGSIAPAGSVAVAYGASQSFTVTPNPGYHVAKAIVDGSERPGQASYAFTNVTADHAIRVYFDLNTYTITASAGAGGSITPSGSLTVTHGANASFTIAPQAGYALADVTVDGVSVGKVPTYTFASVTANHVLAAAFTPLPTVTLRLNDSQGKAGATAAPVTILLENPTQPVSALQFRVQYDATVGLHAIPGSSGYALTARTQGFAATVTVTENGAHSEAQVLLYHPSGGTIAAGAGAILDLLFTVDPAAIPGKTALLSFPQGLAADAAAQPIGLDYTDTAAFTVLAACDQGDVNCDGTIDVLDMQALLNCITQVGSCTHCDLDGDGQYNVIDVQLLVNTINHTPAVQAAPGVGEKPALSGNATVSLPELQLQPGAVGSFAVNLTNAEEVAAGQVAFSYDATAGFDVTGVHLTARTAGFYEPIVFRKDARDPHNVQVFVLFFALNGATITPGAGAILECTYQTTPAAGGTLHFTTTDALLTDASGNAQQAAPGDPSEPPVEPPAQAMLTITKSGTGSGDVASVPAGIACGADCTATYPAGTTVTLSAVPAAGSVFIGWFGSCGGADNCELTLQANQTVEAIFDQAAASYTITASADAGGSIAPAGEVTVARGASQTFTITPLADYAVQDVRIDGVAQGALTSYTFENVLTEHRIAVSFKSTTLTYHSFFNVDEGAQVWRDTDKSPTNPDDDWMCWALAAANILDWTGWAQPVFDSAQAVFDTFQQSWTNGGGLMEYAWQWWFDGTQPPAQSGWAQLNPGWSAANGGGRYQAGDNFFDYFAEDWASYDPDTLLWSNGAGLLETLDEDLQRGFGTTLAVYTAGGGHALSVWGYEYDDAGDYTGIWVTDSDDYAHDLKLLSVTLDADTNLWYLDQANYYGYNGWFIGGVQALASRPENPVPEPGTLLLFAIGLIGGIALKRRLSRT